MYNLKIYALYQAKQPIIHTEETIGNISKIKKLRVIHNGKPVPVPTLSGNSFRGQLRDILVDQMFAILTDNGATRVRRLSPDYYGVLYSGGVMREGSRMGEQMKRLADAIPLLRLMGSAFGNVMLPSKLAVTHIIPYAVETYHVIEPTIVQLSDDWRHLLPAEPPKGTDLLFNDGPLTRKDDSRDLTKQRYTEMEVKGEDEERTRRQMIYYVECIPPGAFLLQEMYSKYPLDDLELGCFLDGLLAFLREPSLGGRSAAGYGQMQAMYRVQLNSEHNFKLTSGSAADVPQPVQETIERYRKYVKERKKDILEALEITVDEAYDEGAKETEQ
ncbi:MAG: hypothetical protein ACUVV0_13820 [Anaerolineae bacterium]